MHRFMLTIREIADHAGSGAELAKQLGITRAAVWQWKQVPANRVIAVEAITRIPREKLRPDLYPPKNHDAHA